MVVSWKHNRLKGIATGIISYFLPKWKKKIKHYELNYIKVVGAAKLNKYIDKKIINKLDTEHGDVIIKGTIKSVKQISENKISNRRLKNE